ncbi:MAG: glycerol kinase GlpK [Tepidimonas ignava]|uniref:Glycerol kinase n=1 Tax=Tepidimonas ignava TaxID=114249 RepID=A0A4R3LHG0_9BURK|nr:glycerol kinase GlpK [Tepidimonas ignava]MCX7814734.1 glycerol kinase GlpK [Tepidimonas ignava]TCS97874.1 glycerol kinase [Tepidimonas ignava]TSE23736.1 Glycerol kinase [Tepidimonas ignava]
MALLLALDQGTTSSRSIVFDAEGRIVAVAQRELTQHYPQPGWVEHDPEELWATQRATLVDVLRQLGPRVRELRALGITNQRETTVVWERASGRPVHRAIVWQDRRAEQACARWRDQGLQPLVQATTGLRLDAYFSAGKLRWLLDHVPGLRARAEQGELACGTVDSWLLWRLTGARVHATDVSNAARTLLWDVRTGAWSEALLRAFEVPAAWLPSVHPSSHVFGELDPTVLDDPELASRLPPLPMGGVAGDQQAALFGQACFEPGLAKNTYGTGCFMLLHTGGHWPASQHGLLTTAAAQAGASTAYALEGSVFVGGAVVQWLRDGLGIIRSSAEVQALAERVPDSGGVALVPAFTGLGTPHWQPHARGAIVGLSRGSTAAHIARAALESIALQSAELLQAMNADAQAAGGAPVRELRVDGGAAVNDLLMQYQADLLGIPVLRPAVTETTALGAAWLAGLQAGVYRSLDELRALWRVQRRFEPQRPRAWAEGEMARWQRAVRQVLAGVDTPGGCASG